MVICSCGAIAVVRTSWTSRNPGRRFFACPRVASACPFLGWVDPPMCDRATDIIPGLLRTRNQMEEVMNAKENEARRLKKVVFVSWVIILILLIKLMFKK